MRAVDRVVAALDRSQSTTSSWLVGEPCVAPPPELCEAFQRAARSDRFPYPAIAGLPELREMLAARHANTGSPTGPDQIVVTAGAKAGLLAVLAAILEPGDELIHPKPCYPAYPEMARRLGARAVAVEENNGGFDGWVSALADRITAKTRAVILASPSNPTGATLDGDNAAELVALCRNRGIRLICDEAYGDFRFTDPTAALAADFDRRCETVVQIRSISKSWALCGWRIGWLRADEEFAARAAACHSSFLNPASGPAQKALLALPEVSEDYLPDARKVITRRIDDLRHALAAGGRHIRPPEGGFYLWIDLQQLIADSHFADATEWCCDLASRSGVGLWPGEDFQGPGFVRLSVTAPNVHRWSQAVDQLCSALT